MSAYLTLEHRIADGDRGTVIDRWRYGRQLLADRAGRKQLPHGKIAGLVREARQDKLPLSRREIQYRLQCANAYDSEAKVRTAVRTFGSWAELRAAGFPPVDDALMLAGCGGDETANAVEAWVAGAGCAEDPPF